MAPAHRCLAWTPRPASAPDSYAFTVFALPTAMRVRAEGAPPISYVRDLDDVFIANEIGKAELGATSDAQPAAFVTPG